MTDVALPVSGTLDFKSEAARARIKARYRAEFRFQLYGLTAVGLTALFLAVVLVDIVVKGLPAFTQNYVALDVRIDPAEIDPQGSRDPAVIRNGDFQALVRNSLRGVFPNVTDRPGRRLLDSVVSTGAADSLRDRVMADPSLVGQTVKAPLLLSDDVDLYYKGLGTKIISRAGAGIAIPSGTSGEIAILTSANDFASEITTIKVNLSQKARGLRREASGLRPSVQKLQADKAQLEAALASARSAGNAARVSALEPQVAGITSELQSLAAKVNELEDEAANFQSRFDMADSAEALDSTLPSVLVAINGGLVKVTELGNASVKGQVLLPLQSESEAKAGSWRIVTYLTPEANRRVGDREVAWLEDFRDRGLVQSSFNWAFFTSGDSREPELAGIRGALIGSALTLLVTLLLCLPIGVAAAIYLEEFAPKNRITEIIEVNINNLAAVPSIVFGLLGLAVFLNFLGLPRSAPLVGGFVLALLVLPTIIIAARAALKAVPPSIKEAALGVGASKQQAIFHHVLPLAMPGIMTGTIIGMAHALGETAPLLMIGMVAFIVEVPTGITDAATVLPVQIYLWSDLPEIAFQAKTAAAIMVLLVFLFVMNGAAIVLRKRFERRW